MTKTEELLKLAEAATPGPWVSEHHAVDSEYCVIARMSCTTGNYESEGRNRDFIAAANPATIKQLVELVRLQHEALRIHRNHYECEDTFYSCPADESAWEERKGECCCGADSANEAIAAYERFERGEG